MNMKLPGIIDDQDLFKEMKIESKTLGSVLWTNGSNPKASDNSVMRYDQTLNEVKFVFKSY